MAGGSYLPGDDNAEADGVGCDVSWRGSSMTSRSNRARDRDGGGRTSGSSELAWTRPPLRLALRPEEVRACAQFSTLTSDSLPPSSTTLSPLSSVHAHLIVSVLRYRWRNYRENLSRSGRADVVSVLLAFHLRPSFLSTLPRSPLDLTPRTLAPSSPHLI